MQSKFKFIHTADIHLGSILHCNGDLPENINDLCKNAVYNAFERICSSAIEYNVDFILISGDLYDIESPSVKAYKFFIEQCKKLHDNDIEVYVIAGNHDCLSNRKELFDIPENVHILGGEKVETIDYIKNDDVIARIIGQSYKYKRLGGKILSDYKAPNNDVFNIGMLHTSLENTENNYVPCSLGQLREKENFHYWALGHVHKKKIFNKHRPIAAFSGIPQGRDMGEQGLGGCFLIEVIDKEIEYIKYISIASIIYKEVEVFIDDTEGYAVENLTDLENMIIEKGQELISDFSVFSDFEDCSDDFKNYKYDNIKGYIVRWIVKGRGPIHHILKKINEEDCSVLVENINNYLGNKEAFIWSDSIVFRTKEDIPELEQLFDKNKTFKELKKILDDLENEENLRKDIINSWGNIWDINDKHEDIDYEKFQVDDEKYKDIIEQAKELVIEMLIDSNR